VTPRPATIPLLCLVVAVLWTIGLVVALTIARFRHFARGGTARDFARPDDHRLDWRLYRAHQNALENVPLFAIAVLTVTARGIDNTTADVLAIIFLVARIAHTLIHAAPGAGLPGNRRLALLAVQLASVAGLALIALVG
jgi:uncharacterized MAPEG superfamily protein